MELNRGRTHGKMEYWGPIVLSPQTQTTPTNSKLRIRLGLSHISHQPFSIKLLEGLEQSMSMKDLGSQSHFQTLLEISLYLLVIGTRPAIRWGKITYIFSVAYEVYVFNISDYLIKWQCGVHLFDFCRIIICMIFLAFMF